MSAKKILVIEDEADIQEIIQYNLGREGYKVYCAADGIDGLEKARTLSPDLVILDLMLPGMDGIDLCRKMKGDALTRQIPIIMVTAKGEESDVVLGLGIGADDYIPKPFRPKEMAARVEAVLRRAALREVGSDKERIVVRGLAIDSSRHEVLIDGKPEIFSATEFRLVHFLASHPGRAFTRDQLLTRIIASDAIVIDRNVDVHIRSVRKKLGPYCEMIETIRGIGYRFSDYVD
jgi:two-component system alkaline phosphatase synthesis response regulator PhoP